MVLLRTKIGPIILKVCRYRDQRSTFCDHRHEMLTNSYQYLMLYSKEQNTIIADQSTK